MEGAKLVLLNDDGQKEINIFINGWGLSKNAFYSYSARINQLELPGRTYLLSWFSKKIILPPAVTAMMKVGKLFPQLRYMKYGIDAALLGAI